jgi:hypothetical protein
MSSQACLGHVSESCFNCSRNGDGSAGVEADLVRDEKIKIFRSIRPFPLDRLDEQVVIAIKESGERRSSGAGEPGVSEGRYPTFAALKVFIDNWRWNDVPFYLSPARSSRRERAEIAIYFKPVPPCFRDNAAPSIDTSCCGTAERGHGLTYQIKSPVQRYASIRGRGYLLSAEWSWMRANGAARLQGDQCCYQAG